MFNFVDLYDNTCRYIAANFQNLVETGHGNCFNYISDLRACIANKLQKSLL